MSKIKDDIVNAMHTMRADEVIIRRDSVIEVFNLLNKLKMDYVIIEKKTLKNHLMKKMKVSSEIDYSSICASSTEKRFWNIDPFKRFNVKTNLSLEINHIANESSLNYIIEKFPNYAVDEIERYFDKEQDEIRNKFSIGDKVKINLPYDLLYHGLTGTISQILVSDYVVDFGDKILSQVFKEERLEKITENSNSSI